MKINNLSKNTFSDVTEDKIIVKQKYKYSDSCINPCKEQIHSATVNWMIEALNRRYEDIKEHGQDRDDIILRDILFHFTFKWRRCGPNGEIDQPLKDIQEFIKRKLIGPYNMKRNYFSPTYVQFADVAGSRGDKSIENRMESPHHHGLILVHPYTLQDWADLIQNNTLGKLWYVDSVDIGKCYDPVGWLNYAGKYNKNQLFNGQFDSAEMISGFTPKFRDNVDHETANSLIS